MMNNAQSIHNIAAHIHLLYSMANDLNGAYGTEPIQKLMGLYAEAFNHITTEVLPMLGMSKEAIEDLIWNLSLEENENLALSSPKDQIA